MNKNSQSDTFLFSFFIYNHKIEKFIFDNVIRLEGFKIDINYFNNKPKYFEFSYSLLQENRNQFSFKYK